MHLIAAISRSANLSEASRCPDHSVPFGIYSSNRQGSLGNPPPCKSHRNSDICHRCCTSGTPQQEQRVLRPLNDYLAMGRSPRGNAWGFWNSANCDSRRRPFTSETDSKVRPTSQTNRCLSRIIIHYWYHLYDTPFYDDSLLFHNISDAPSVTPHRPQRSSCTFVQNTHTEGIWSLRQVSISEFVFISKVIGSFKYAHELGASHMSSSAT